MLRMFFKNWMLKEDSKSLAKAYSDLLKNVPQDPKHHPEGDALTHIRLVRKSIFEAIKRLSSLKNRPPFSEILEKIDFNVSENEMEILFMCAWLHDIGKATATTVGDINYMFLRTMDINYQNDPSKIRSIGHDSSSHYSPLIKSLEPLAPEKTKSLYIGNKDLIDFIIDHHMDFRRGEGFSKSFIKEHFVDGKVIPSQKIKLLLILMWADKMGRTPDAVSKAIGENEKSLIDSSKKSIQQKINDEKTNSRRANSENPATLAKQLLEKGLSLEKINFILKSKFSNISDEDIKNIIRSL